MIKKDITEDIIDAITDRKGKKIRVLDLEKIDTAPASKFIVCQGGSNQQVGAIADSVREKINEKLQIKPYNYDGYKNSQWIIIDYGDIMVHVFQPEFREFYNLEELWSDGNIIEIPDLD